MEAQREHWGSRLGFVMAAVGSAVGLGNMWRFSYLTAESGGAAFVILYIGMTALVALPIMLAEFTLGRGAGKSPVLALEHYGGPAWKPLGWLFVAAGFLILAYYSVIAGWTVRYAILGLRDGFAGDAGARFESIATGTTAIVFHAVFMAITVGVVAGGVRAGIERTNLVLMPTLFVILVGLAIYASRLEGASLGYFYYLRPSFEELGSFTVLSQAAGQAFFSLSLGMGAMLTYASYLDRNDHLPNESLQIAGTDFLIAFIAGLAVFPLIFAHGLEAKVGESTVGALFITLPAAFEQMGVAGRIVGIFFFAALVVGALTSAIALLEQVVATGMDVFGWPRRPSAVGLGGLIFLMGVPAALDLDILGKMDQLAGNVFLVVGSLALAIFVGWRMQDPIKEAAMGAANVRWFGLWQVLLRYVAPPVLVVVLYFSVRALFE